MDKKAKNHNIMFVIIAVVIMIGVGIWYYMDWDVKTYFSTENAKVTADLYTITSQANGKLVKLGISEGSSVKANEVIGRVENGPYIKSPVNGQVVKSDVVLNQMLAATSVVAVVAETDKIYVQANIEETDIVKVKEGQPVLVQLDAYPGKKFKAHVKELNQVTQTAITGNSLSFTTSGTYTKVKQLIPVKIVLDDVVDLKGLIGTNATIKIKLR